MKTVIRYTGGPASKQNKRSASSRFLRMGRFIVYSVKKIRKLRIVNYTCTMCKEELLFCRISTLNVENSTVLSRFSTFSTNAMLKTWKNTNCNTQKKRALCAIPFLWEPKRKKGKLRISRGYPQSFFVCRMYPCICCLYPFGARDTSP